MPRLLGVDIPNDRSTVVSLTVTPMICAHLLRAPPSRDETILDRIVEAILRRMIAAYAVSLEFVLRHRVITLLVFLSTIAVTVELYIKTPKGYFPQYDTGLIFGGTATSLGLRQPLSSQDSASRVRHM